MLERRRGPGEADLDGGRGARRHRRCSSAATDWLGDFLATGEPGGDPVPIDRIDHITLAQPFEAFDEAGLFYRSVLDLQPSESQELAAPDGLVRSRARRQPRRPRARRAQRPRAGRDGARASSSTSRSPARTRSPPRARCATAASRCWPSPDNYYDDLAARLELEPALLAELRELDVLYDRSADGELLHFYTAQIGGRVFFEVLERRGGYGGYGAAQLTDPDGRAARGRHTRQLGGERCNRRRWQNPSSRPGPASGAVRPRSANCRSRRRSGG